MDIENRKVLVVGGAGFIGSELVHQLADAGARVTVLDDLTNGRRENLADLGDRIELVVGDLRDRPLVAKLMRDTRVVFHLACLGVRHSIHSPHENADVNATGTLGLLDLARAANVGRFVYVSSSEVYGTAMQVPMTELHPAFPMTVYGAGKLAGECYTRAYHRTYNFPTVVVRPFNAYGPRSHHEGDSGEVIPKFLLRGMARKPLIIFGDGSQTRDFTFVSDTARGIMLSGLADAAIGETLNIGSGFEITVNDLAQQVRKLLGDERIEIQHDADRPGDVLRLFADMTRAHRIIDFRPTISLAEGLERLHQWYLSTGVPPEEMLKTEVTHNWQKTGS
jgi:UDP-glucose 4-epimerase